MASLQYAPTLLYCAYAELYQETIIENCSQKRKSSFIPTCYVGIPFQVQFILLSVFLKQTLTAARYIRTKVVTAVINP